MSTKADKMEAESETRRDFLSLTAGAFGAVGTALFAWPFIDSLNPAADTLALATVEVDLAPIERGQSVTVVWQGKPVLSATAQKRKSKKPVPLT